MYCAEMTKRHPELTLHKPGVYIGQPAYLKYIGASSDGVLVEDADSIDGIIEINCPFSAAKLTLVVNAMIFIAMWMRMTSST